VACKKQRKNVKRVVVEKTEWKRHLGRPKRRWRVKIITMLKKEDGKTWA